MTERYFSSLKINLEKVFWYISFSHNNMWYSNDFPNPQMNLVQNIIFEFETFIWIGRFRSDIFPRFCIPLFGIGIWELLT
jgi:hypothetical protein